MTTYSPHAVLSRVDNKLLAEYANSRNLFENLEISKLKQTDIKPIYEEMQKLDVAQKIEVERDLHNVAIMADKRLIQMLFKALQHDDIAFPEFDRKRDNYDKAMWALLNYTEIFDDVLKYSFPQTEQRHWQKFPYPVGKEAITDKEACTRFSNEIKKFFREYDGRGEHCKVFHHSFQDYEYLFAHPSEYPEKLPIWKENGEFDFSQQILASSIIFVFKKNGASVDLYVTEPIAIKRNLFALWAKEILGLENVDTKPKRSYDLTNFSSSTNDIDIPAETPVSTVAVYKIRFVPRHNPDATYTIEADISTNKNAVYDELNKKYIHIQYIKNIGLEVILQTDEAGKTIKRRFEISASSCSLKHIDEAAEIRKFLQLAKIDISQ